MNNDGLVTKYIDRLSRLGTAETQGWPGCVTPPPWVLGENEELDQKYYDVMLELEKYGPKDQKENKK